MTTVKSELADAVKKDDLRSARRILSSISDVNIRYPDGDTQFNLLGNFLKSREMLDLLVEHGFDVQAKDSRGQSALHMAVESERIDIISQLLALGVPIDIPCGRSGTTPLHWAVTFKRPAVIKFLVHRNASIDAADENGNTPLHQACRMRYSDLIELLCSLGADPTISNNGEKTPLHAAIEARSPKCFLALNRYGQRARFKDWVALVLALPG